MVRAAAAAFIALAAVPLLMAGSALAAEPPPAAAWVTLGDGVFYQASLRMLVILFVLAILIESALAVIFNWRLFQVLFYGRGVRTLVSIVISALAVWSFKIDVVHTMLSLYGFATPGTEGGTLSRLLTALILAGGSAGVYRVLVALGYREARTADDIQPKPKTGKAWISVRTERRLAVGPIYVRVSDAGPTSPTSPSTLAGVIAPQGFWPTVRSVFFLDRNRFPPAGGYEVEAGKEYRLEVIAKTAAGETINADINGRYSFADGAMIDFRVEL